MDVLKGLEPKRVFHFFEEISRIPHGSGNTGAISSYLKVFAEERKLFCRQDELGNIIIIREASPARKEEEPYILQAHMDMVAVSAPDVQIDMKKEPLRLKVESGRIFAEGTSLGGDDGIGVAYCLAVLDDESLSLPRLEVILTVDEETGMEGATGIDLSMLRGRRMINLDQEEEGVFITSCAGGARVDVEIAMESEDAPQEAYRLVAFRVTGLVGGHSGMEIGKGLGNAIWLLGSLLCGLSLRYDIRLVHMKGGLADNAIPREAEASVLVREEDVSEILSYADAEEKKVRETLQGKDPGFTLEKLCHNSTVSDTAYTRKSTAAALACICKLPNGVISMSEDVEGLVETSLNLGVLSIQENCLRLQYAVRSSVDRDKEELCRHMRQIAERAGAQAAVRNAYPGWAYRKDSPLRERMVRIYEKMYGKKPVLEAIHAGLECGILSGKIPDLDCVSIGPDLQNVHTAEESMDVESVGRVWAYLLEILTRAT
ncbi:MAG: aminoacyl-histidine dipeptidase [Lachnospiraceae bacterium]|nr:aminoacyl-histidine dipeptidase [Lachnospiraceae bacterium]